MLGLAHFEMLNGMVGWLSAVQKFEKRDVNGSDSASEADKMGSH